MGRPKIANMLFKKTFRFNQKIIRNDSYVLGGHIKNFSTCYKYVKSLRVIEEYIILIDILKFIYIYIELCLNMQILRHFRRCKAKAENNAMASGKRGKERRVSIDHCLLFCKQPPSCKNHKTQSQVFMTKGAVYSCDQIVWFFLTSSYDHKI